MSSSIEQYFNEVQAVCQVLSELVQKYEPRDFEPGSPDHPVVTEEDFTSMWQAVELLSRGATYIMAQMQAESAKAALYLPEPHAEVKKQPKAARLYDGQGRPIA